MSDYCLPDNKMQQFYYNFHVSLSKSTFREGELVSGQVQLDLKDDMVIEELTVQLRGVGRIACLSGSTYYRSRRTRKGKEKIHHEEEVYLQETARLYTRESADDLLVRAGAHLFPFSIQLPTGLPSSVSSDRGYIKYEARATLERPWCAKTTTRQGFNLTSVVLLSELPHILEPYKLREEAMLGLPCCFGGSTSASWQLNQTGFVVGDKLQIRAEIWNNSLVRIKHTKAILFQHLQYKDVPGKVTVERKEIARLQKGEILPGGFSHWAEHITVPDVPPTSLKGSNLMDLWYTLMLKVEPSGLCESLTQNVSIIIGTPEPRLSSTLNTSLSTRLNSDNWSASLHRSSTRSSSLLSTDTRSSCLRTRASMSMTSENGSSSTNSSYTRSSSLLSSNGRPSMLNYSNTQTSSSSNPHSGASSIDSGTTLSTLLIPDTSMSSSSSSLMLTSMESMRSTSIPHSTDIITGSAEDSGRIEQAYFA